jgi:hypothetical protein
MARSLCDPARLSNKRKVAPDATVTAPVDGSALLVPIASVPAPIVVPPL